MTGSYVAEQVRLTARIVDRVSVVHGMEWAGGPAEVTARLREPFDAVLRAMAGTGGLVRPGAVGPVARVPVLITGGMSVADRAEALVRDVGIALGGSIEADVVHGHVGYLGGLLAARLAPPGARVFATEHSTGLRELLADPAGRDHYREVLERADHVLCVSRLLREQLLEALPDYAERIGVLPNPVDVDAVPRRAEPPQSLHRWLFSGGLVERKGVRRLVQAFVQVAARDPKVTLTLMGEGPLRPELEDLARTAGVADRLTFTGMLPHAESLARMREHDLLLAPSTYETFHLVVPEAVAAGLPVIVTRSGGPEEVLEGIDHLVGRFVDVSDDPASLVEAYDDLRAGLGALDLDAARDELRRRYGPDAVAQQLADLYGGTLRPEARPAPDLPRPVPAAVVVAAASAWRRDAVVAEAKTAAALGAPVTVLTRDEQLRDRLPGVEVREPGSLPVQAATSAATSGRRSLLSRARREAGRLRRRALGRPVPARAPRTADGAVPTDATLVLGDAQSAALVADLAAQRPDLQVCIELPRSEPVGPAPDSAAPQAGVAAPHVVMMVANDVSRDTRVRKSALAVAAAGARVTVVGYAPDGQRHESRLGDVTVIRVPVPFVLRDRALAARARRRRLLAPGPLAVPSADDDRARRLALTARERDLARTSGGRRRLRAAAVRAQWQSVRVRHLVGRGAERGSRLGWRAWDKARSQVRVGAQWRRVVPEVDDYELAFGPVLDQLAPDVIHAHDVHMVGLAERASARAAARGRTVPWVYDAHEWVSGLSQYGGRTARVVAAWADLEREYVRAADRVITVSAPLAEALQRRYGLAERPAVIHNIPPVGAAGRTTTGVRATVALADDVPLLVYSGGVQAARGVDTAVRALTLLPETHLAVVAVPNPHTTACRRLHELAVELGVADRLHLLDPVAPDQVSAFLSSADVGLIPLRHFASHEMALANKLFEYLHAGVPTVVSDCRAQADFVTTHGTGEVHTADDAASLADAVRRVLGDPERYRSRLADPDLQRRYAWEHEAATLRSVYRDLVALPPAQEPVRAPGEGGVPEPSETAVGERREGSVVLGI
ncbi:MAG TPA: glycosyltransferase family 4 protein, partial [Angustibacter sp.]|nr:glycosyltransferase family 4 protein [Angustibacter sp.]